jgi:hypothetical protein
MKFIMHDWNDNLGFKLLQSVIAGVRRGYLTLIATQQLGSQVSSTLLGLTLGLPLSRKPLSNT